MSQTNGYMKSKFKELQTQRETLENLYEPAIRDQIRIVMDVIWDFYQMPNLKGRLTWEDTAKIPPELRGYCIPFNYIEIGESGGVELVRHCGDSTDVFRFEFDDRMMSIKGQEEFEADFRVQLMSLDSTFKALKERDRELRRQQLQAELKNL